jgi:hypothetical protein
VSSDAEGNQTTIVYTGKVIASPYQEDIQIEESPAPTMWTESYYEAGSISGKLLLKTEDGIVEQTFWQRDYPYGYGKDLKFTNTGEEVIDGVTCQVYSTQYTETVGGGIRSDETLDASIYQKYYIDPDKQQVVMLYTDLSEYGAANKAINKTVSDDSLSLEEALKLSEAEDNTNNETIKFSNYNGNFTIEPLQ